MALAFWVIFKFMSLICSPAEDLLSGVREIPAVQDGGSGD